MAKPHNLLVGAVPNWAELATYSGPSADPAECPPQALATLASQPRWRSPSTDPPDTRFAIDLGAVRQVGAAGVARLNLSPDGLARVRMSELPLAGYTRIAPVSLAFTQNISGTVADVDEDPDSIDGDAMVTTLSPGQVGYSFGVLSGLSAAPLAHHVRVVLTAPGADFAVLDALELRVDGVLVRDLLPAGGHPYTVPQGATRSFWGHFSADKLDPAEATEIWLTLSTGEPPAGGVRVEAVSLFTTPEDAAVSDSGFLAAWSPAAADRFGGAHPSEVGASRLTVDRYLLDADGRVEEREVRYLEWEFLDPLNAAGFVEAVYAPAGGAYGSERAGRGISIAPVEPGNFVETAGSEFAVHGATRTRCTVPLNALPDSEAYPDLWRYLGARGITHGFLFRVAPESGSALAEEAHFFGRLAKPLEVGRLQNSTYLNRTALQVQEWKL